MMWHKPDRKALFVWWTRLVLSAFFPALLAALFYYPENIWWKLANGLWLTAYLLVFAVYYPIKYWKLAFAVSEDAFVVKGGVFYNRMRTIYLANIQYVTVSATLVQQIYGLSTVIVMAAGGSLHFPCMRRADALALRDIICPLEEEG